MNLTDQISIQRAMETESKVIAQNVLEALIASVNTVFSSYSRQKTVIANLEKLASLDLLSSASAIETMSLEFAKEAAQGAKLLKKEVMDFPSIGGSIDKILKGQKASDVNLMINETSRLLASGYSHPEVQQVLIGTKTADYKDGIVGQISKRQETVARTAAKVSEQVGLDKARQANPDVIGYLWESTLDGVTTLKCLSLSGNKYFYAKSGEKPLPPQHYNCRSTTSDILKSGPVETPVTFKEWARENPKDALDAMGPTRYKLLTDGKLKIQRFTDLQANPMTLSDLKKRNPYAFKKAKIK